MGHREREKTGDNKEERERERDGERNCIFAHTLPFLPFFPAIVRPTDTQQRTQNKECMQQQSACETRTHAHTRTDYLTRGQKNTQTARVSGRPRRKRGSSPPNNRAKFWAPSCCMRNERRAKNVFLKVKATLLQQTRLTALLAKIQPNGRLILRRFALSPLPDRTAWANERESCRCKVQVHQEGDTTGNVARYYMNE